MKMIGLLGGMSWYHTASRAPGGGVGAEGRKINLCGGQPEMW